MKSLDKSFFIPLLLVSYEIATYLSNDMYLPALPQMMADLSLTLKQTQLTLTTWFLGSASMPLVAGILSDRYGRRPVLLWGGIIYILASLLCALANNIPVLLLARLLQGAMVPTMLVPGYAVIHESYDRKEAIKILATMSSISVLAPALGPLFGSFVLFFASWRWIFALIMVWAAVCILLLSKWMPETLPADKRHAINLARLGGQYWRVITNRHFMQLMTAIGFTFAGFLTWVTAGPLLVMLNFHYSGRTFGIFQVLVFAVYILGNRHVKILLEKMEVKTLIYVGLSITLFGGLMLSVSALVFPNSIYPFLIALMIYSYGSALCFSPLNRSNH